MFHHFKQTSFFHFFDTPYVTSRKARAISGSRLFACVNARHASLLPRPDRQKGLGHKYTPES